MKRQMGWMTGLAAVFLCLCGMVQIAPAQTAGEPVLLGTYYQSDGSDTVVLRLIRTAQGISVYGAATTVPPQPLGLLGGIGGTYDPGSRQLRLNLDHAVANTAGVGYEFGEGTYNPVTQSFSITFTSATFNEGVTRTFNNVALDAAETPYMVGIWHWNAAGNSSLLFSNPPYGGQIHITSQEPDGSIRGTFGHLDAGDVGTIVGRMSGNHINFTRSGKDANGTDFVQVWDGDLNEQKLGTLGVIEQRIPVDWSGDFEMRWTYFQVPP